MSVVSYMEDILASKILRSQITDFRTLEASEAVYSEPRHPWPTAIADHLDKWGIRLYSHQALATDHIRAGHSVVVSTPTASGKSLIYTLPVLEEYIRDRESHALYLFPLKALAQDQLQTFQSFVAGWPSSARPTAALYDGDTSESARRVIRLMPPTVLITNPEMLHLAILPWHTQWTTFLAGVRFIVVDEAHTYRGVFGSNMALVFRRLNRIITRLGASPIYVLATATVGNPVELATNLTDPAPDNPPVLIDTSGAPRGARHFIFINPTILSPSSIAIDLIQQALKRSLRTIVYCRSRRMTELISLWVTRSAPKDMQSKISAYRAGFLPEERRDIEARMANGTLGCVVSTSALELGIDIGSLDVCILVGYPGTIMATMQRGGRVGRAQQESLVILIAGEDALDQYFITHPDDFFSRPPEKAIVNPDNEVIAARHIECAAQEYPLHVEENWLKAPGAAKAVRSLVAHGDLLSTEDKAYLVTNKKSPQRSVSLRSAGNTLSIEDDRGHLIGSIDSYRAWHEVHPGAVYLHRGKSYVIDRLEIEKGKVVAKKQSVSWYTRSRAQKSTVILEEYERQSLGQVLVCRGKLKISDLVTGYEKRANRGNQLLTILPISAPPQVYETEGLWYVIPDSVRMGLEREFIHFMGSIHAMEHAIIGLLPLEVMADRNDFGGISIPLHPQVGKACVFVYDGLPGGAGLTREAFRVSRKILENTLTAIMTCKCPDGCPSCVHSPKCGSGNRPISKSGAIILLTHLLADGREGDCLAERLPILHEPETLPSEATAEKPEQTEKKSSPPERYVVFDVETRLSAKDVGGWGNADKMGVSVVVAYDSARDVFLRFEQDKLDELFSLMRSADLVIGFNSIAFDYLVLKPFAPYDLMTLPTLDLLAKIRERTHTNIGLNSLARATLGMSKSGDGLKALDLWKEGKLDEIAAYCEDDVRITLNLYRFGLENGFVLYIPKSGQKVRVDIDFGSATLHQKNPIRTSL